jgi:MFS family permease
MQATVVLIIAYAVLVGAYLFSGSLSQRMGRRRFLLMQGASTAIIAPVLFWLIVSGQVQGVLAVGVVTVLLVVVVVSIYSVVATYINERFRVGVRSSGYGLGYTLAVIIPSFYAFFQMGLSAFLPFELTPLVLIVIGGLLIFTGAALGPETKDVDLGAQSPRVPSADAIYLGGSIAGLPYSANSDNETPRLRKGA